MPLPTEFRRFASSLQNFPPFQQSHNYNSNTANNTHYQFPFTCSILSPQFLYHTKSWMEENGFVSVIIRNLSFHCNEENLKTFFASHPILWIAVKRNSRTSRSLLHAFAHVPSMEHAQALIQQYDNVYFMGRIMRIELCDPSRSTSFQAASPFQIHFAYNTVEIGVNQRRVTEEVAASLGSAYGEIVDVLLRRHTEVRRKGRICNQFGFGFLYFRSFEGVQLAHGQNFDHENINYSFSIPHGEGNENGKQLSGSRRNHVHMSGSSSSEDAETLPSISTVPMNSSHYSGHSLNYTPMDGVISPPSPYFAVPAYFAPPHMTPTLNFSASSQLIISPGGYQHYLYNAGINSPPPPLLSPPTPPVYFTHPQQNQPFPPATHHDMGNMQMHYNQRINVSSVGSPRNQRYEKSKRNSSRSTKDHLRDL